MLVSNHNRCNLFLLVGTLTLSIVFVAEYVFDLQPCTLCLWQRLPWSFVIFIALCDALLWRKNFNLWLLYGFVLMVSSIFAFYHIGVERGFWESFLTSCTAKTTAKTAEEILLLLQNPVSAIACDQRTIFFFDFSFTDFNFLLSLGLALFALLPFVDNSKNR